MMTTMTQECPKFRGDKEFLFVSYLPYSEPFEDEKARARLQVRSHVAQRRHGPDNKTSDTQNKHLHARSDSTISNVSRAKALASRAKSSSYLSLPLSPRIVPMDGNQYAFGGKGFQDQQLNQLPTESTGRLVDCIEAAPFPSIGIDRLGSGSPDPFQSYPPRSPLAGSFEKCFSYNRSILLPSLIPSYANGDPNSAIRAWSHEYMVDETLCLALSFAALSHKESNRLMTQTYGARLASREYKRLLVLEMELARAINRTLQGPHQRINDSLILSALCMANSSSDKAELFLRGESPFRPPLCHLQSLDVYGMTLYNQSHYMGLVQLIRLKGGLHSITMPALAAILSFSDILTATKTLSSPLFPFYSLQGSKKPTLQEIFGFSSLEIALDMGQFCKIGFTQTLAEAFQAVRIYLLTLEGLQRHENQPRFETESCETADKRNLLQHSLLSLPCAEQINQPMPEKRSLYEACRISVLIFSIGVVFPIPYKAAPLPKLIGLLKIELQAILSPFSQSLDAQGVLIWILTIGGIVAIDTEERPWFAARLNDVVESCSIQAWAQFKRILRRMLWLDSACDAAAYKLWDEISTFRLSK